MTKAIPPAVRLERRVAKFHSRHSLAGDCWVWKGARTTLGYGCFSWRGKQQLAHRVSWIIHNGVIPQGMCVLHRCDNPPCVNPGHLFIGTKKDNTHDCMSKNRFAVGERKPESKLTEAEVLAIRASAERGRRLAERYGVSPSTVCEIRKGRKWKHLLSRESRHNDPQQ